MLMCLNAVEVYPIRKGRIWSLKISHGGSTVIYMCEISYHSSKIHMGAQPNPQQCSNPIPNKLID